MKVSPRSRPLDARSRKKRDFAPPCGKSLAYFMMEATDDGPASPRDTGEIQAVEWLTPVEALAALTHENDRQLVARVFNINEKSG
jgi:hypothetical protein